MALKNIYYVLIHVSYSNIHSHSCFVRTCSRSPGRISAWPPGIPSCAPSALHRTVSEDVSKSDAPGYGRVYLKQGVKEVV